VLRFPELLHQNGGVEIFGHPLTEMAKENERIVQYFEYARLEWRPSWCRDSAWCFPNWEKSSSTPTKTGSSGSALTGLKWIACAAGERLPAACRDLRRQRPDHLRHREGPPIAGVQNAQVILTIKTPDGQNLTLVMPPTDANGMTSVPFAPVSQSQGRVEVLVKVDYQGLSKTTRTSYRIW
jgi:hypothetical protein